jgi:hypothetical protein
MAVRDILFVIVYLIEAVVAAFIGLRALFTRDQSSI